MFKTRLISGIILVAIALVTIISGGTVLYFTTLALSLIAAGELYNATGVRGEKPFGPMDTVGYAAIGFYYVSILFLPDSLKLMPVIFGFLAVMFVYVLTYPRYNAFQTMSAFFGLVYTGLMISCIYLTRELPGGGYHVWLIFLSAWGSDTCAYCVGMLIGKHKMAPVLSPKKSWEGLAGGVETGIATGVVLALLARRFSWGPDGIFWASSGLPFMGLRLALFISALLVAAGVFGDLIESMMKRSASLNGVCGFTMRMAW